MKSTIQRCGQKEKGLPHANEISPAVSKTDNIVPQKKETVKADPLRELRVSKQIMAKDMVAVVQGLYPKYDKMLQSKCERGSEYGVQLRKDAMDMLLEKYAPEQFIAEKHRRNGRHRLKCRISCRLEDAEYADLIRFIKDDGFDTMQAWLAFRIRLYLAKKKGEQGNA